MNERPFMINKIKKDNSHVYVLFVGYLFFVSICMASWLPHSWPVASTKDLTNPLKHVTEVFKSLS